MLGVVAFSGFEPRFIEFLRDLAANNTRDWFQARYAEYQALVMQPARDFVAAMGEAFKAIGEDVRAEPRVHGSILAITRDTRFAQDKTPYKTHLDLWFWQPIDDAPNRDCPGYYLRVAPDALALGAGVHRFSESAQASYRRAVTQPAHREALERLTRELEASGFELGGRTLKRAPANSEWLKHTGLYAGRTLPLADELYSDAFPQWCVAQYRGLAPLQRWLVEVLRE
jgi:uncharacterized protein (TIGR02453 family)